MIFLASMEKFKVARGQSERQKHMLGKRCMLKTVKW